MTRVRIKGFKIYKDRHGKMRCYHRLSGAAIDLTKFPLGSAEFMQECSRVVSANPLPEKPRVGTLAMLIVEYKTSSAFSELAPATREDYERVFNYLKPIGDTPLSRFTPPLVVKIRDKALEKHKWRFANKVKTTLSLLFSWGYERGYNDTNPAKGIKKIPRPKTLARANRPWADEERYIVLQEADWHLKVPLAIMAYTGIDPIDVTKLRKVVDFDGQNICLSRSKTGGEVWYPCPAALLEILAEAPTHDAITVCASSLGKSWTYRGLSGAFARLRKDLEERGLIGPNLTMKGLRHTVANILREIGKDNRTIADALGQKEEAMAAHYATGADLRRKMREVKKDFDKEEKRRRKMWGNLSNPQKKVSNSSGGGNATD